MGMFDRLYNEADEWQTKAFGCALDAYRMGDQIPYGPPFTYQVEVLGGPIEHDAVDAYATVRDGLLVAVPAERDPELPLIDYYGGKVAG